MSTEQLLVFAKIMHDLEEIKIHSDWQPSQTPKRMRQGKKQFARYMAGRPKWKRQLCHSRKRRSKI